ncbi:Uncharacterised protein [Vibrio cholerae]|nr:Uncharacterised protein [Vibrio cholerae]
MFITDRRIINTVSGYFTTILEILKYIFRQTLRIARLQLRLDMFHNRFGITLTEYFYYFAWFCTWQYFPCIFYFWIR